MLYAISFSGFYFAMLLVLLGLILRPVGFKYRSKIDHSAWRAIWDAGLFLGGFIPALIFGVALGNVLEGVPFYFDDTMRDFYTGSFWALLNPFAILDGLVSVFMLIMHGGVFLCIKTEGAVATRAKWAASVAALVTVVLFAVAGFFVAYHVPGYVLSQALAHDGYSNPLHKVVHTAIGAWLNNYSSYPALMIVPIVGFVGVLLTPLLLRLRCHHLAWITSGLGIAGIIATVGVSMFPFILPSSIAPNASLMVWDASSSQLTLFIMLIATLIFLPLIIMYTSWVYYVMRGKVITQRIQKNSKNFY